MSDLCLLDTNMVSHLVKGRSFSLRARVLKARKQGAMCLSVISEAELLFGLRKRPEATRLAALIANFLAITPVLEWSRETAVVYSVLRADQEALGRSIASLDLLIAAHALSVSATLITADQAFFQIPGLRSENWAPDLT